MHFTTLALLLTSTVTVLAAPVPNVASVALVPPQDDAKVVENVPAGFDLAQLLSDVVEIKQAVAALVGQQQLLAEAKKQKDVLKLQKLIAKQKKKEEKLQKLAAQDKIQKLNEVDAAKLKEEQLELDELKQEQLQEEQLLKEEQLKEEQLLKEQQEQEQVVDEQLNPPEQVVDEQLNPPEQVVDEQLNPPEQVVDEQLNPASDVAQPTQSV
jgi:hypothetical protein